MLRYALVAAAAALVITTPAAADHVVTNAATPTGYPADEPAASSGEWSFVGNVSMGPAGMQELGTDVELFTRDGKPHTIVGSVTLGFRLFRYDDVGAKPVALGDYASAFPCAVFGPATIIQNKVENDQDLSDTLSISGWQDDVAVSGDGMIAGIATDSDGRCHDTAGGGIELVDISDLARPHLFHLTRHFGEAHTLTIDDARGLVYVSSSDTQLNAIDIVDFRSCTPPATDLTKFLACKPVVARYQFPVAHKIGENPVDVPAQFKDPRYPDGLTAGTADKGNNGCHDITVQGNFLYCAAINATVIFDISGLLQNGVLTGTHLNDPVMVAAHKDPTAVGVPTHCPVKDGTPGIGRPASVTDCEVWSRPTSGSQDVRYEGDAFMRANLHNANMFPLAVIRHDGTKPPNEDISISHESDPTEDGTILMVTDERGGGLTNVCGPGSRGGGGAWFYDIRDKANPKLLKQPDGTNGVFITDRAPMAGNCTIHVITQIPGRNVIVTGWYIEGTHVFSFAPNLDAGTVSFNELGHYVAGGTAPQTWTSYPIGVDDGRLTIQTGDMTRGSDILSFLLDPPGTTTAPSGGPQPQPGGPQPQPGAQQPTPPAEGGVAGAEAERTSHMVRGKGALKRVRFAIDLRKAPGTKVTFVSRTLRFAVRRITTLRFAGRKATLAGVGRVNGKRVRYTLVVVDRGVGRRDSVTLRLSNGVRIQGRLVAGNVIVR